MTKFYLFLFIAILFGLTAQAQQCDPCPRNISLQDGNKCFFIDLSPQSSTVGQTYYGNSDSALIIACKNGFTNFSIAAIPYFDGTSFCTYGSISIDSVSTTNGTTLSFINNQVSVQWGNVSTGSVYISFGIPSSDPNVPACKNIIILKFKLIDPPIANFIATPSPACFSNPTTIAFNSNATTNANTFSWNFGDGFTATGANPTHAYTAAGIYTVCMVAKNVEIRNAPAQPNNCPGCADTICSTITIDALPPPPITCITTLCNGTTQKYCTSAAGCSAYNWSVIGGTITNGAGTSCITVNWGSGVPQGVVSLNVAGCSSPFCTNNNVITVPIIPTVASMVGASLVCVNTYENYSMAALPGTSYSWAVSGGGFITGNNTNTNLINIHWLAPGTYTVTSTYTNAALQCGGSASTVVTVAANLSITGNASVCAQGVYNYNALLDNPAAAANCFWSILPAATIQSGQNTSGISILWPAAGSYTITANTIGTPVACTPTQYVVTVLPLPVITNIIGATNICSNGINQYYATTTIPSGYFLWTITNGSYYNTGSILDTAIVTWGGASPYAISVQQYSAAGCASAPYNAAYTAGTIPSLAGTTSVCADDTASYTITNMASGNFNWYITPPQYGTVYTGQGTNTAQIIWSGNNNPGVTNTVFLHYGICNADSIAINITDPIAVAITASGSLCGGAGVSLSTGIGSGTFLWSSTQPPITPTQSLTTNSLSGLNQPGIYSIDVQNINNTGCNVSGIINIADIGRPIAKITANNVLNYCVSNLPNFTISALTGIGYTYQWFFNNALVGTSSTLAVNSSAPCNITSVGIYTFYAVTSLNNCTDTSNIIVLQVYACSGGPGSLSTCPGVGITINSVTGCNPFTINATATGPLGSNQIPGSQTLTHYINNSIVSGTLSNTFTSPGFYLIKVCKNVLLADNVTVCTGCVDTSVLVTIAADFAASTNCGVVTFINNSTTFAPTTISSYSWSVTDGLGNPIPPIVASYNNASLANPVLTINQSGTFIITLSVIGSNGCTALHSDTIVTILPDASFIANISCVGTPINFANAAPTLTNYWNFGDATSSYVSPTQHTYSSAGVYSVVHAVSDINGCLDTATNNITINPKPICTIVVGGPNPFCSNDSLLLNGCAGLTNFQWFRNGVAIGGAINSFYYATSGGNYSFTANNLTGCNVQSDTIIAIQFTAPIATITQSNIACIGDAFSFSVPNCASCSFVWKKNGNIIPLASNVISFTAGVVPFAAGTPTVTVTVTDFATGCSSVDTLVMSIYPKPTVVVTVFGVPNPLYCSNNLYTLSATSTTLNALWTWAYGGQIVANNDSIVASAAGVYTVMVTGPISGCTNTASVTINASPDLNLFPIGCDTLCDTLTGGILVPIPNINNVLAGYTINWFNNAPPFTVPIYSGISLPIGGLSAGPHALSIIAIAPNGCQDTSNVYDVFIKPCTPTPLALLPLQLIGSTISHQSILQWQTFGYAFTDRYEVQTSDDGIIFTTKYIVGKNNIVADNSTNILKDDLVNNQVKYYRVIQYFTNQSSKISNSIQLQYNAIESEKLVALPNVFNQQTDVLINTVADVNTQIIVTNAVGKVVMQQAVLLKKGSQKTTLQLEYLSAGIYFIQVNTAQSKLITKVVKQ
jgi:PKD repeat protein